MSIGLQATRGGGGVFSILFGGNQLAAKAARPTGSSLPSALDQRKSSSPLARNDAVYTSLNSATFTNELEKHLDDVQKGRGYLSKQVNGALRKMNHQNGNFLSETDPDLMRNYAGYTSGLLYNEKSRFVHGVNDTAANLNKINSKADIEALQKETEARYADVIEAARAAQETSASSRASEPLAIA